MNSFIKNSFFLTMVTLLLTIPFVTFAEVIPLAPLPTKFGDTQSLSGYINTIFQIAIVVGAVLAVLRIIWGGYQYMISEAVTAVKDARTDIAMAVVGLLLLLSVWLILNIINPNITDLDALNFGRLQSTPSQETTDSGNAPPTTVPRGSGGWCLNITDTSRGVLRKGQCYSSKSLCEEQTVDKYLERIDTITVECIQD